MNKLLLPLLLFVSLAAAQTPVPATAVPESTQAPRPTAVGTPIVATTETPLFRPKVIMRQEIILPKDPFLAGTLSLVMPGTGQAYCGKWLRGIGFLVGAITSYALAGTIGDSTKTPSLQPGARAIGTGVLLIAGFTLHGWSVLDAAHLADVHNRQWLETP